MTDRAGVVALMRSARRREAPTEPAWDEDNEHYGAPSQRPPEPPTERDGLRVGDEVLLVGVHRRGPWPARIVGFLASLDCCMVVEWTGRRPTFSEDRNTICRKDLESVTVERSTFQKPSERAATNGR